MILKEFLNKIEVGTKLEIVARRTKDEPEVGKEILDDYILYGNNDKEEKLKKYMDCEVLGVKVLKDAKLFIMIHNDEPQKTITCKFDGVKGSHFPIGKVKESLFKYLDSELKKHNSVQLTLSNYDQFCVVDLYAKLNDCDLFGIINTENDKLEEFKVYQGKDLCNVYYYLTKENLEVQREIDSLEEKMSR